MNKEKASKPTPVAVSDVTGRNFVEVATALTRARIGEYDDLAASVGMMLIRAANSHVQESELEVHRPRELSWSGFRIMWLIWVFGQVEARDLARLTGVSRQTTSSVLGTLESKGLVHRERTSATDKRLVAVSLTSEGVAEVQKSFAEQNKLESRWFSALKPYEQQLLIDLLERVVEGINKSSDHTSAEGSATADVA